MAVIPAVFASDVIRLSEPVQTGEGYEVFGAPVDGVDEAQRLGQIIAAGEEHAGKQVRRPPRWRRSARRRAASSSPRTATPWPA
jgi:hypothetical protein